MSYCNTGLCRNETTRSWDRGNIEWPLTEIGTRRALRCPYAYTADQYVNRDCIIEGSGEAYWTDFNVTICPLPPFSRAVEALADRLVGYCSLQKISLTVLSGFCINWR